MKIFAIIFLFFNVIFAQTMWINELHYDNIGTDTGEFVEVIVPVGTNPAQITVTLYNGNGGASYGSHTLDTFTQGATTNGKIIYYKRIAGIQNGAPDGLSLDDNGTLIQFLSYEGTFTATNGPANGQTSVDIGVSESNSSTAVGSSLQLLGSGTQYSDFTWGGPFPETPGAVNSDGITDQTLPVKLTSFTANAGDGEVTLRWKTASELENQGFAIMRSESKDGDFIELDSYVSNNALRGAGTSSQSHSYRFVDNQVFNGSTYWYKLIDIDNNGVRTEHGVVQATPQSTKLEPVTGNIPQTFALEQNVPNPFNPTTKITFDIPQRLKAASNVTVTVSNIVGQKIATLFNGSVAPGSYTVEWNGRNSVGQLMPSGIYIYTIKADGFSASKRMTLVK